MIREFIQTGGETFDPETAKLMGDVYDAVCKEHCSSRTAPICQDMAFRIIDSVRRGERDPARLRAAALGQRPDK